MRDLLLRLAMRVRRPTYCAACALVAVHPILHPLEHWLGLPLDPMVTYATAFIMSERP
jgi:hypothetical protein